LRLAESDKACVYCELPKAEMGACASGFPGCARADDLFQCDELTRRDDQQRREGAAEWIQKKCLDDCWQQLDALSAENERLRGKEREDLRECVRVGNKCHIENAEQTHAIQWMLGKLEEKCAGWASSYSALYARAVTAERERDEAQAHARHWREAAVKENERAMEYLHASAEAQAHAANEAAPEVKL